MGDNGLMNRWMKTASMTGAIAGAVLVLGWAILVPGALAQTGEEAVCPSVEEQPVKIEIWLPKPQEPRFPVFREELALMGHTRVFLWPYPAKENPSRVVAIGRCVPAYIARHALEQALAHFGEVQSLVHQKFVHDHWVGLGTSLFAESSFKPVTSGQLKRLMDPKLTTAEFQTLYRQFTVQNVTVPAFGLDLPNPKLMQE